MKTIILASFLTMILVSGSYSSSQDTKEDLKLSEDIFFAKLNKYSPPIFWSKFALNYGNIGPVWLVDDSALPRSIRRHSELYVNIRGEFWKNYQHLFNAKNYHESVVLKFLHEMGHIVTGSVGDPTLKITDNGIHPDFEKSVKQTPIDKILDNPSERAAWGFALEIRDRNPERYSELIQAYEGWYRNYSGAVEWK